MNITDVPDSGIYIQKGSIAQLVVEIVDAVSGLPIQLQAATNLKIQILYPDRAGWRSFPATLYTDGSDGKISYITKNNGTGFSDLNQVGLYKIQGSGVIGSVPLPPSLETDFYIQPNVEDQATTPVEYPVLRSENGKLWQVYVLMTGNLDILLVDSAANPSDIMYMQSSDGQNWSLTATNDGHLETETVTGPFPANIQIYLADSVKKQWVVNVLSAGNLDTN